jgi:hypothetical protein
MRFAYWIKDLTPHDALASPRTERLRRACPNVPDDPEQRWMAVNHPSGGTLLVYPARDGAAVPLTAFGPAEATFDGLTFYPPLEAIDPLETIKAENARGAGSWYGTTKGLSVWVPLATATPREVILVAGGGMRLGDYANEFGVLAHELWDTMKSTKDGIGYDDARLWRLIMLAVQRAYALTDELVQRCGWFTTADIAAVTMLVFGLSPKALAAARAGSASADPATQTSRSQQPKRRPSTPGSRKRNTRRTCR